MVAPVLFAPETIPMVGYEEGFKPKVYLDSKGYPTIGHGFMFARRTGLPLSSYENFKLSQSISLAMLEEVCAEYAAQAETLLARQWSAMNADRRGVLISMIHQLGIVGVRGFSNFCKAAADGDWKRAYEEMLDSKWYKRDTPQRAMRHALVMLHGSIKHVYSGVIKL